MTSTTGGFKSLAASSLRERLTTFLGIRATNNVTDGSVVYRVRLCGSPHCIRQPKFGKLSTDTGCRLSGNETPSPNTNDLADNARRFAPGIMTMEAVTIFIPCYELVVSRRRRNHILGELQAWNEKKTAGADELDSGVSRTPSEVSHVPEAYSRKALERCLKEDSSALLRFAAAKEFSGENIIFLNYVRDWKASWAKISESKPEYDWNHDLQYHRLHLFKIAVEIYAVCVDLKTADFPINIESQIYSDLTKMFGEAAQSICHSVSTRNVPGFYNMAPTHRKKMSTVITVDEDTHALCLDAYGQESQSILNIEPRVPDSVIIPADFTIHVFDQAERSVKNLVFQNTWPKFINTSSDLSIYSK